MLNGDLLAIHKTKTIKPTQGDGKEKLKIKKDLPFRTDCIRWAAVD